MAKPVAKCQCGYDLLQGQDCPECGLPFAEATAKPRGSRAPFLAICIMFGTFFVLIFFPCMCGYLNWFALPVSCGLAAAAWWQFASASREPIATRILVMLVTIVATTLLVKNLADVLWLGHDTLF